MINQPILFASIKSLDVPEGGCMIQTFLAHSSYTEIKEKDCYPVRFKIESKTTTRYTLSLYTHYLISSGEGMDRIIESVTTLPDYSIEEIYYSMDEIIVRVKV